MQHDWNLSIDETRRVLAAEHFLQPHSQDWQIGFVSYSTRTFDPLGPFRWVGAHRSSWRDCSQERSACNGW